MGTFLSYSRVDSDFADLLHRLLTSKGYDAWIDRQSIPVGGRWDNEIEGAIKNRSHLTVVLSPESVVSQNVADEWSYALDEGKVVVPLLYRSCDVPMRLRRMNWIDFITTPFADAFSKYLDVLGNPDHRPNDRYELARRDGMVYVALKEANIRIAFIYTDYPTADSFLKTIWFTLLWSVVPRESVTRPNYDYGLKWSLRDTTTKLTYPPPNEGILIHEMGIEPNSSIDIVLHT
jgi:hypothetical protein